MQTYKCLTLEDFTPKRSSWPVKYESWLEIADALGYITITDMLYDLYITKKLSFENMEKIIGFSRGTIRNKVHVMCIVRGKGGANNPWGLRRKPENRIKGSKWYIDKDKKDETRRENVFNPIIEKKGMLKSENKQTIESTC